MGVGAGGAAEPRPSRGEAWSFLSVYCHRDVLDLVECGNDILSPEILVKHEEGKTVSKVQVVAVQSLSRV